MGISITMCACSHEEDNPALKEDPSTDIDPNPNPTTGKGNVLVAYFSCTNMTKGIAENIASLLDDVTFRIEAETPYTSADLDYNTNCRANREQNDPKSRPAILLQ